MRLPSPLGTVDVKKITVNIAGRHRDDRALSRLPEPENVLGTIEFVLRNHGAVPKLARHDEIGDALLLTRVVEQEVQRLQLGLLRAGLKSGMEARQLGEHLGIRSRQGVFDRIKSLSRKVRAAELHVSTDALKDAPSEALPRERLHAIARELLEYWDDLYRDPDTDVWREGITLVLRQHRGIERDDRSIATQLREAIAEIEEFAASKSCAPARTSAAMRAFEAARGLVCPPRPESA
jgi:hypothetical protein